MAESHSPPLAEPFAQIFTDRAEADWAFDLLQDTAKRLGIQGAYDPRFAITLARRSGRMGLHLNFGGWLVLGFHGPGATPARVDLALLASLVSWDERFNFFSFARKDGEPEVRSYHLPLDLVRPMTSDLHSAYLATLDFIAPKFSTWQRASHWKQHNPEIAEALFKSEKREQLFAGSLTEPELRYERHLTAFYQDISEEREEYEVEEWEARGRGGEEAGWEAEAEAKAEAEWIVDSEEAKSEFLLQRRSDVDLHQDKKHNIQYWKIAPGENAWNWEACRNENFIGIGWEEMGDVSNIDKTEFDRRVVQLGWEKKMAGQLWKFAHINVGDRIVANRGFKEVLGIGTVTGPYYFVPEVTYGHRLPVRWDDLRLRRVEETGWRLTLRELTYEKFVEICNIQTMDIPLIESEVKQVNYPLSQLAADTALDETELARWVRAIERKGQAILYGPPGTGKTFVAEKLARHLIGGGDGLVELVQFHPAYAYEDFIQGIRPESQGDFLTYPLKPGRFLEFCEQAKNRQDTCVLIIDEINRANLSRVFGELMYLLEYRERAIPLAGGGAFHIPANVRLIGTMNTADRSIALVDHALRRRFAFIALYPNFDLLRRYHQQHQTGFPVEKLVGLLHKLNHTIADRHYEVGVTFFLRPNLSDEIEDIWRTEIEPYLEEYFFDRADTVEEFRWEKIKSQIVTGWDPL